MLPGGDGLEIQFRPVTVDGRLEQRVDVFEFFLEFGAILVRVLAEHRHGTLVLAGRDLLEIDAVTIEEAVEIGDLCQHADGPQDCKWCRIDLRRDAGHQVTAARSNLVDTDHQWNLAIADTRKL